MSRKLYASKDRDEAHRHLADVLAQHPAAECRDDPNAGETSVYDGPEDRPPQPPGLISKPAEDALVDRITAAVMIQVERALRGKV